MNDSIRLYRFMGLKNALKSIEERRFRVGRLLELNDPFEWRFGVMGIVSDKEIFVNPLIKSFLEEIHSERGILCFSETAEDSVLWSHYADGHRGVAFEVDHFLDPDRVGKVKYSNKLPLVDVKRLHQKEGVNEYLEELLKVLPLRKARGWEYEKEYRVYIDISKCETSGGHYFLEIPENFLTRVILGVRCEIDENYVRRALKNAGLKDTEVVRAKMDKYSYSIKY